MTYAKYGTDREQRINYERMREYRLARTREQMAKFGLGAIITWDAWNIRYISGAYVTIPTRWMERQCVVLPRNGDPYVYCSPCFNAAAVREAMPWLKGKVWTPMSHLKFANTPADIEMVTSTVANILAEHGLTNEVLGIDGSSSEFLLGEAFKAKGIKVVDAKQAMHQARKIKNTDEIECIRMACSNAEAAFADIVDAIRPGVTECQLVGVGMKTLYSLGADETQEFACASGPRTNPLWIDYTDREVRPGDLVIVDINGNSWQGYKSCYYRTFSCGRATEEQKALFRECRDMMYAGMSGIKSGNTTYDIAKNWPDSPKYWGWDNWNDVRPYATGHGLGISLHELPLFAYEGQQTKPVELEEGMVLAIENWTGKKGGKDGVRLEENVVVTKDGYDLLTKFPVQEITECWI
jgi:Xaa-Pro aminopeptidase